MMTKTQFVKLFLKTLMPKFTLSVDKTSKGYMLILTVTHFGKSRGVQIAAKEAAQTEINLIELLNYK